MRVGESVFHRNNITRAYFVIVICFALYHVKWKSVFKK